MTFQDFLDSQLVFRREKIADAVLILNADAMFEQLFVDIANMGAKDVFGVFQSAVKDIFAVIKANHRAS